jgi:hypothetical protein
MKLGSMTFSLSRAAREAADASLLNEALAKFQERARAIAKGLGFPGYQLGQITVRNEGPIRPQPVMYRMQAAAPEGGAGPVPAEGGKNAVTVFVSGSVVLGPGKVRPPLSRAAGQVQLPKPDIIKAEVKPYTAAHPPVSPQEQPWPACARSTPPSSSSKRKASPARSAFRRRDQSALLRTEAARRDRPHPRAPRRGRLAHGRRLHAGGAGNIGVCIGTSGPAGTDMITGLYSAQADSIPILCITGQAPRARLYKEDFQAVDIEAISKPVTKWSVTVREPRKCRAPFSRRST